MEQSRTSTPDKYSILIKVLSDAWRAGQLDSAALAAAVRVFLNLRGVA